MNDDHTKRPPRLTLTLDMEKYLGQLSGWEVTDAQAREIILAMWWLMVSAAEIGFDISPVQQAQKKCGQLEDLPLNPVLTAPDRLYLENSDWAKTPHTHLEEQENKEGAP